MNLEYQEDGSIILHQASYIEQLLLQHGMEKSKLVATPAVKHAHFPQGKKEKEQEEPLDSSIPYREAVGQLLFLSCKTRPDISYAVSVVAAKQENPTQRDWMAVKRIFRYLNATKKRGILFTGGKLSTITAYCDADHAGDQQDRKSRSGYVIFAGSGPIDWHSKKQGPVALSTAEAEYIAMAATAQSVVFARQLYEFITGQVLEEATRIWCDNQAAIAMINKPSTVLGRSKHIDVKYHYVRQVAKHQVSFEWIKSANNLADMFTKALAKTLFNHFANSMMTEAPFIRVARRSDRSTQGIHTQAMGAPRV